MGLVAAVASVALTGLLFEALTDRDWSVGGWEWPEVLGLAVVIVLAAVWLVSTRLQSEGLHGRGVVKQLVKSELGRLGYSVQRLPSPAADPQFELDIDFEYVLAHHLAARVNSRPFFFLQVGANDGAGDDPLYRHVREKNWHGILVEPQPEQFAKLLENYEGSEDLAFVNAAIAEQPGVRPMYVISDATGAPIEAFSGIASFREGPPRALHAKMGRHYPGSSVGTVAAACTTFADVLSGVSYLDLLQIDVEGYDVELLTLFDFARIKPSIVRFEYRHVSANELDDAFLLLARHGYLMVREEYDVTAYLPNGNLVGSGPTLRHSSLPSRLEPLRIFRVRVMRKVKAIFRRRPRRR